MTKEEQKAKSLIEKYQIEVTILGCGKDKGNPCVVSDILSQHDAKKCATLECQSIIDELKLMKVNLNLHDGSFWCEEFITRITFYKGVIKAIEQQ